MQITSNWTVFQNKLKLCCVIFDAVCKCPLCVHALLLLVVLDSNSDCLVELSLPISPHHQRVLIETNPF